MQCAVDVRPDVCRVQQQAAVDGVFRPHSFENSSDARSVVPRGLRVAPRSLVVDRIVDEESSDAADEVVALGTSALTGGRTR